MPTPAPPPVTPPAPAPKPTYPADVLGITGSRAVWKLQYGRPGDSQIIEKDPTQLLTFTDDPWFTVSGDGWASMRARVDAVTTTGSSYPRTELRELTSGWDTSRGTHRLDYDIRVPLLPPVKPELVGGQIHDDKKDLMEILFRRAASGGVEVTWRIDGSSSGQKVVPFPAEGARCRLEVVDGKLSFYVGDFGTPVFSTTSWPQSSKAYFKVGAYVQSNTTRDLVPAAGQADFRDVVLTHSDTSPSPTPAARPVVMIIRHGEKPGDKNDHTLSAAGQERARALAGIFVTPKAGLYRPDYIFASKGASSAMRMVQTAQPTADALGLTLDTRYDSETAVSATAELLASRTGVTLAVLEHSALPAVAKALGRVTPSVPSTWPDDRFDVVWVFVGDGKGGWTFTQVPELVRPGDKSTPIK